MADIVALFCYWRLNQPRDDAPNRDTTMTRSVTETPSLFDAVPGSIFAEPKALSFVIQRGDSPPWMDCHYQTRRWLNFAWNRVTQTCPGFLLKPLAVLAF